VGGEWAEGLLAAPHGVLAAVLPVAADWRQTGGGAGDAGGSAGGGLAAAATSPHQRVASRSKAMSFGSDPILDCVGAAGARLALAVVVVAERLQIFTCMGRWAPVLRLPNALEG
jgi:hypothetical protein